MSAEWVTALATFGTFIVITASATAALVQLRHMRGSNQIAAFNELREAIETAEFRAAYLFTVHELPKRLTDPREYPKLAVSPLTGEYEPVRSLANLFESFGTLVKHGVIDKKIACDTWSFIILGSWRSVAPLVAYHREALKTPGIWENFEYLAVLSEDYLRARTSSYPVGVRRMPPDTTLRDALKKNATTSSSTDI